MRKTLIAICTVGNAGLATHTLQNRQRKKKLASARAPSSARSPAGPVGFVVGAAIGAKVGDTIYQKNESIDDRSMHSLQADHAQTCDAERQLCGGQRRARKYAGNRTAGTRQHAAGGHSHGPAVPD